MGRFFVPAHNRCRNEIVKCNDFSCRPVLQYQFLSFSGSPQKAEDTGVIHPWRTSDPRPEKYRNMDGYNALVRSNIINYCAHTNSDLTMRYLYSKADIQAASQDHDYCVLPLTEYLVDRANSVSFHINLQV